MKCNAAESSIPHRSNFAGKTKAREIPNHKNQRGTEYNSHHCQARETTAACRKHSSRASGCLISACRETSDDEWEPNIHHDRVPLAVPYESVRDHNGQGNRVEPLNAKQREKHGTRDKVRDTLATIRRCIEVDRVRAGCSGTGRRAAARRRGRARHPGVVVRVETICRLCAAGRGGCCRYEYRGGGSCRSDGFGDVARLRDGRWHDVVRSCAPSRTGVLVVTF